MDNISISYSHLIINDDPRVKLIEEHYENKDCVVTFKEGDELQIVKDGLYGHVYDEGVRLTIEGEHITGLDILKGFLPEITFKQCLFESCNFKSVNFRDSVFEACTFIGSTINACFLHGAKFINCTFVQCELINELPGERATLQGCTFSETIRDLDVA